MLISLKFVATCFSQREQLDARSRKVILAVSLLLFSCFVDVLPYMRTFYTKNYIPVNSLYNLAIRKRQLTQFVTVSDHFL